MKKLLLVGEETVYDLEKRIDTIPIDNVSVVPIIRNILKMNPGVERRRLLLKYLRAIKIVLDQPVKDRINKAYIPLGLPINQQQWPTDKDPDIKYLLKKDQVKRYRGPSRFGWMKGWTASSQRNSFIVIKE